MERTPKLSLVPDTGYERPLHECSDDELMQLACAGRSAAFACLVRRYQVAVRAYCARVCGSAQADDVAQDVFLAVYRSRTSYAPGGRFRGFLFTVADRRCKNALRSRRARREGATLEDAQDPDAQGSLDEVLAAERRRRLDALVRSLPESQRTAIWMRFGAGLDYREVAEAVGCPEPTARTRVHQALSKLRALCAKRGGL